MTSPLACRPTALARPALLSTLIALVLAQGACSVSTEAALDAPREVAERESGDSIDSSTTAERETAAEPDSGQASPTPDDKEDASGSPGDEAPPPSSEETGAGPGSGQTPSPTDQMTGGPDSEDAGEGGSAGESESDTETASATNDTPIGCGATLGRALELINAARAEARSCGNERFEAAEPLVWDTRLQDTGLEHSTDMARNNFFSHTGSDGSTVGERVSRTDYDWQSVGENIAAGQPTIDVAMSGWVDSPGHCANLMNPRFEDVSVACVADDGADYGVYWTQVFGRSFSSGRR